MSTTDVNPTHHTEPPTHARPGPLSPHRTDLVALVFGLGFLAIGVIALSHQLDWFSTGDRDVGGIALAVIGAIGVLAVLAAGLRRSRPTPESTGQSPTVTPHEATES